MRINELLIEAFLKGADFYMRDRLVALIKRLEEKQPFFDNDTGKPIVVNASSSEIANLKKILADLFDSRNKTSIDKTLITKYMPVEIGGVPLSKLFKDGSLGGKGGTKGEEKTEEGGLGNLGPAVEVWKAIGIFTKLSHRRAEQITIEDLMQVKNNLSGMMTPQRKKNKLGKVSKIQTAVVKTSVNVPDFNNRITDEIKLIIDVAMGSWQRAMEVTPETDKKLWGSIQAILKFVNENNALKRYTKIFASNGKRDPISIAVVGGEGEKADIRSTYFDTATNQEKPLSSLTFSVKAGSNKISQSSGSTVEGVKTMFRMLGLNDQIAVNTIQKANYVGKTKGSENDEVLAKARYNSLVNIFNMARKSLASELANASNDQEKRFLSNFFTQVKGGITGGEKMIMVDFNPNGTYKKFNPQVISNLVKMVDLEARPGTGDRPAINIFDKNSNMNLIQVRLEAQSGGRLTIHVELSKNTKELAAKSSTITPKTQLPQPQQPIQTTPGIRNQARVPGQDKEMIGQPPR